MKTQKQRLLISIRGKNEALAAIRGGAHIADVEYPASALGTPYPLNIHAVRNAMPKYIQVATNIGEEQNGWSNACQAALGVALAGADIVKLGLARMSLSEAKEFGPTLVRTVKKWFPRKQCIPALFADDRLAKWYIDPIKQGPSLAANMKAEGLLIDTFDKTIGLHLMDYYTVGDIKRFVDKCHNLNIEAWLAGSIAKDEMRVLWEAGVDVICIRGAACQKSTRPSRFGDVDSKLVRQLAETIPPSKG